MNWNKSEEIVKKIYEKMGFEGVRNRSGWDLIMSDGKLVLLIEVKKTDNGIRVKFDGDTVKNLLEEIEFFKKITTLPIRCLLAIVHDDRIYIVGTKETMKILKKITKTTTVYVKKYLNGGVSIKDDF